MWVFEMISIIFESISTVFGVLSISMVIVFLITRNIGFLGIDTKHKYFRDFVFLMLSSIIIFLTSSTIATILGW